MKKYPGMSSYPAECERFQVNIARVSDFEIEDLPFITKDCLENKIELLIARIPTDNIRLAQVLESKGYRLMDILCWWKIDLTKKTTPEDIVTNVNFRLANKNDSDKIAGVTRKIFENYVGHYHSDPRLNRGACVEAYADWAKRLTEHKTVYVAEDNGKIVGFGAVVMKYKDTAEYILGGVLPEYQRRGIYRSILINCIKWCRTNNVPILKTSTQVNLVAVQKVWMRLGFEPYYSEYTFHKWFKI